MASDQVDTTEAYDLALDCVTMTLHGPLPLATSMKLAEHVLVLVPEIRRLRAERDAALAMLRKVLYEAECYDTGPTIPNSDRDDGLRACCPWCGAWANGHDAQPHESDCVAQAARALLSKKENK